MEKRTVFKNLVGTLAALGKSSDKEGARGGFCGTDCAQSFFDWMLVTWVGSLSGNS